MTGAPAFDLHQAQWIASTISGGARAGAPAPYLRKEFTLPAGVKSARLSITALGLYEAEINGQVVGDQQFAPGWTNYNKRLQVQTHDVTALLKEGGNALGVVLGDGWYCGFVSWLDRQGYGDRPRLLAQLDVELADGKSLVVSTDETWRWKTGPIVQNDILLGEHYDARLGLGAWSSPGYQELNWYPVTVEPAPNGMELVLSASPAVRRIQELAAKPITEKPDHIIFDLGQNFSGRLRLKFKAAPGRTLQIKHGEMLTAKGGLYTENLRGPYAHDVYTCATDGEETWEPRFTFHGFRYALVSGLKPGDTVEVVGIVLHNDMPRTGTFACSNPLLNQLQHNILWGQKSNFLDIPTDCPQRNERLGWTGDAQVFIRTAAFNMNVRGFFHKWMQDVRDAQHPNGAIPSVAPDPGVITWNKDGGPAWADAGIICPWTIYLCYGDKAILEENYEAMSRFVDFMVKERTRDGIRENPDLGGWHGYGDWLALDGSGKLEGMTPSDLIGTAFLAYDAEIMTKVATLLGHEKDARRFAELRETTAAAFNKRYVSPAGIVFPGTQTAYTLALHFNLLPDALRPEAARQLALDVEKRGFHLSTGFVGTPYLLEVLETHGHLDVAYKLLEQETFPGWLFPVKNGATTIWERWDGWTAEKGFGDVSMNSFNHYAYGAVGAWMYRSVAGLELDPADPGYAHVIFRPRPGGTLTWAEASLDTPKGKTAIRWDLSPDGNTLSVSLDLPEGARGTLLPPPGFGEPRKLTGTGPQKLELRREKAAG
jgi:alpha-L-rhamnosidase